MENTLSQFEKIEYRESATVKYDKALLTYLLKNIGVDTEFSLDELLCLFESREEIPQIYTKILQASTFEELPEFVKKDLSQTGLSFEGLQCMAASIVNRLKSNKNAKQLCKPPTIQDLRRLVKKGLLEETEGSFRLCETGIYFLESEERKNARPENSIGQDIGLIIKSRIADTVHPQRRSVGQISDRD